MQKNIKLLLAISVCAVSFSAKAAENTYRPYVGLGYSYNDINAQGFNSYNNSGLFMIGSEYSKYFSTEMFYQHSDKRTFNSSSTMNSASFSAYGLDMIASLPFGCEEKVSILGTAGIGYYTSKTNYKYQADKHDNGRGYRVGAGIGYTIDDNWSLQFIGRYVGFDKLEGYDHMMEYSFGVKYAF